MRKNQKYTQEEMFAAIKQCQSNNISYSQYCNSAGIHYATFKYWVNKYSREQSSQSLVQSPSFIPVTLNCTEEPSAARKTITIHHANGIRIECPVDTPIAQLSVLLKNQ